MIMKKKIPKNLTKEEIFEQTNLTVGDLKKFLYTHDLPNNAPVMIERVKDHYYEESNWKVYPKIDYQTQTAIDWNKDIDSGEYEEENFKKFTDEQIDDMKNQYHPAFSCARYEDDKDMLFIDLHY